jgi:spore coat polysaccharide biosynthesis protein SpsF
MKVVAFIQARMGSTRLPGKVLMDLAGEPMLARVVNRSRRATTLHEVVVATTTQPADEAIVRLCTERGWPCFRGSEEDVLDRYERAAEAYSAEVIVRITSDCPLIEPAIIDRTVREFMERRPDVGYACNFLPQRTFPRGLDVEVMSRDVLRQAWQEDCNPAWREGATEYVLHHPDLFLIHGVTNDRDYSHMRWTVDEPADLAFVQRIYDHFGHDRFSWLDGLGVLAEHPDWLEINRHVKQKVL